MAGTEVWIISGSAAGMKVDMRAVLNRVIQNFVPTQVEEVNSTFVRFTYATGQVLNLRGAQTA